MTLFCGGGTGGHLVIVDAVADFIEPKIYIGSKAGQDRKWFANDPRFEKKLFLDTTGVVNKRGIQKLGALVSLCKAIIKAYPHVRNSDAVFSVGGFSAAPAAIAAILARKPLYIHEQNSVVGKLNSLLKPFCKTFFHSFGNKRYSYPVKQVFFDLARDRIELKTVIFLGGSQGASGINKIALEVAKRYPFKLIHQCGDKEYEQLKKEYANIGADVELFCFSDNLAQKMKEADFAVARAGASTLWELAANRLPTLFVPYPYAASDHQFYNAKTLVDEDLAWVVRQEDFDLDFFETLSGETLLKVSKNLGGAIECGGAKKIAQIVQDGG